MQPSPKRGEDGGGKYIGLADQQHAGLLKELADGSQAGGALNRLQVVPVEALDECWISVLGVDFAAGENEYIGGELAPDVTPDHEALPGRGGIADQDDGGRVDWRHRFGQLSA